MNETQVVLHTRSCDGAEYDPNTATVQNLEQLLDIVFKLSKDTSKGVL